MKRIFSAALLFVVLSNTIYAQALSDAVRYTDEDVYGSARIMALGGAFTALGGDPGSVALNPAGSAVANYSSFAITPGFNIALANPGSTKFQFDIPNVSANFAWDTHQLRGVKRISFSINSTTTALYGYDYSYRGRNEKTSLSNYMAAYADGLTVAQLKDPDVYDKGIVPWPVLTAWKSAMIDPDLSPSDPAYSSNKHYWGMSQNMWSRMSGPVNESYDKTTGGYKRDIAISAAFDVADVLYAGATFGISNIRYSADETVGEEAVDRSIFTVSRFKSATYNNNDRVRANGIYGQFGVIVVPVKYFRFGVSYKTPTRYTVRENFECYGKSVRRYGSDIYDTPSTYTTETANDSYVFVAPGVWNFGVAGVIANRLVLSVDYTLRDYRNGCFKSLGGKTYEYDGDEEYPGVNRLIKSELAYRHTIKAGAEIKLGRFISGRLGYNYIIEPRQMDFCCGLGYDSQSFFYADLAFKYARCATDYVKLYGDYYGFADDATAAAWADRKDDPAILNAFTVLEAPTVAFVRSRYTIALTFGFRF